MTMIRRLSSDARKMVMISAAQEARRRGDRRLGTDHLLLGLLNDTDSVVTGALGVGLDSARTASDSLDRAALESVGVHVTQLGNLPPRAVARRLPPLTSGARAVLRRAVEEARRAKAPRIEARDFLLALLDCDHPDPAAELFEALGVDRSQVRRRLAGSE
jgi:ATP-dependent Clp protease ATP-binding subunit ClpA